MFKKHFHSFIKYVNAYYVSSTMLGSKDSGEWDKQGPCLHGTSILVGVGRGNG